MTQLMTLVINLDRAVERRARIASALDSLGIAWQRLPAVDGSRLSEAQRRAAIDEQAFQRKRGMPSVPGELGCYLSHVEAMRHLLAGDAKYALILEDDVIPGKDLVPVLDALMSHPDRWDMVKLSAVHTGTPVRVLKLTESHWLAVMFSSCTGASAYLVNRRAAQVYQDRLLPMTVQVDHVLDQGWRFGIKVRLVTPQPAQHDDRIATTIAQPQGAGSRKFHWSRRLPSYLYRLGNETRRLRYAVRELWGERRQR
jgi:glycosyl transferase, family 25